ncbi:MAG: transposase [Desulfovibrio sp.]|nr:transposase [Desulfovibrio sp.]
MDGVLWVLRTGAAWADLPERFPSSATCYRRFSKWIKSGLFRKILEALARDLEERGAINLSGCFIDGIFAVAKKGAQKWERPSGAKVRSSWSLRTLLVFRSPCTRILPALMKSPFLQDVPILLNGRSSRLMCGNSTPSGAMPSVRPDMRGREKHARCFRTSAGRGAGLPEPGCADSGRRSCFQVCRVRVADPCSG